MDQPSSSLPTVGALSFILLPPSVRSPVYDRPMPHDRGSGPYEDGKPVTHTSKLQKIANEKWPERDKDGTAHARNIRPATHDDGTRWTIDVTVRLEFEHDGEVFIDGRAERWANGCVCVRVNDPRVIVGLVWVAAADVRRR